MSLETIFVATLAVQTLHLLLHDLVSVPPLNDLEGMRKLSKWTRAGVVAGNTLPSAVVLVLAVAYRGQQKPLAVLIFDALYFMAFLLLAYRAWYHPYFFGATPEAREQWKMEYERTHVILPRRGDNPTPNTAHVLLHMLFVANAVLLILVGLSTPPHP